MNSAPTCPAEAYDRGSRAQTRCIEPLEHAGRHTDGCMGWCDEPVPGEVCPRCGHLEPITLDVHLVIEASQGDDGRWCASVTGLHDVGPSPGCFQDKAHGATKAEAVANVQRLALRTLADRVAVREPPPRAAPPPPASRVILRHTPFAALLKPR